LVGLLSGTQRDDREISALFGRGLRTPAISKAANLAIKYRSADGHFDRLSAMGRRSRGRPHRRDHCARPAGCSVAKAATATIPIIFATGADPVELGLVSSVNPPGDNVTGVTFLSTHSGQTVGVAARARRRDCARWQALGVVPAELSRLFRRLFLERLTAAHKQLQFFGNHTPLANAQAFAAYLAPLRKTEWVVYSKRPFGGPDWPISPAIPPRRHRQ
jgi:ABC transporter substrate binding protein